MRPQAAILALAVLLGLPGLAAAQQQPAAEPRRLGDFGDWTAATYTEGGQKICYAFTRAARSEPSREEVMLMVTHRGDSRDEVAMRAGHSYPRNAPEVRVAVGSTELEFYTGGEGAYAREDDRAAAVAAFRAGREAVAQGPAPGGRGNATDAFSLMGFTAAHEAISRECPAGGRAAR